MSELKGANKGGIPHVGRKNNYLVQPETLYVERRPGKKYYDPRVELPLDESIIKVMMAIGVEDPLKVTKAEVDDYGEQIVVYAGRQRYAHIIEANKRRVAAGLEPFNVEVSYRVGTDEAKAFEVNMVTNHHRTDDDMLTEAKNIQTYMETYHKTVGDAALLFRCSDQTIYDRLALLECIPAVQTAIIQGIVKPYAAVKLAKLNVVEQRVALEEHKKKNPGKAMTTKEAKAIVARSQGKDVDRLELVAKARKAMKALTAEERGNLFDEFRKQETLPLFEEE